MTNSDRPYPISGDFFVGTSSKLNHLEEAMLQRTLASDELLLGFFDGIFFDAGGNRVGGLALNDYLLITNSQLTLWARDQFKDYVDHFPLSHAFVTNQEQKDALHGTLHLEVFMPDTDIKSSLDNATKVKVVFDLIPLPDLALIANMITILGTAQREMLSSGAKPKEVFQATESLFLKTFVTKNQTAKPVDPPPAPANQSDRGLPNGYNPNPGSYGKQEEAAGGFDDSMTPLSRLDRFDSYATQPGRRDRQPSGGAYPGYPSGDSMTTSVQNNDWVVFGLQGNQAGGNPYAANSDPRLMDGSRLNQSDFRGIRRRRRTIDESPDQRSVPQLPAQYNSQYPPSLIDEQLATEGIYTISRIGRVAWDGLEKIRKEAGTKLPLPNLQSLKENGPSLRDITEFMNAANSLLDTIGHNPAAREIAMAFISKAGGMLPNSKQAKEEAPANPGNANAAPAPAAKESAPATGPVRKAITPTKKEAAAPSAEETPGKLRSVPLSGKAMKVERRKSDKTDDNSSEKETIIKRTEVKPEPVLHSLPDTPDTTKVATPGAVPIVQSVTTGNSTHRLPIRKSSEPSNPSEITGSADGGDNPGDVKVPPSKLDKLPVLLTERTASSENGTETSLSALDGQN